MTTVTRHGMTANRAYQCMPCILTEGQLQEAEAEAGVKAGPNADPPVSPSTDPPPSDSQGGGPRGGRGRGRGRGGGRGRGRGAATKLKVFAAAGKRSTRASGKDGGDNSSKARKPGRA